MVVLWQRFCWPYLLCTYTHELWVMSKNQKFEPFLSVTETIMWLWTWYRQETTKLITNLDRYIWTLDTFWKCDEWSVEKYFLTFNHVFLNKTKTNKNGYFKPNNISQNKPIAVSPISSNVTAMSVEKGQGFALRFTFYSLHTSSYLTVWNRTFPDSLSDFNYGS